MEQLLICMSLSLIAGLLASRAAKAVRLPACRMPTVTACLPMLSNALSRNSLPMTKAMKPSATCVMMP